MTSALRLDHDACYRAVRARDRRFDGVFCTAVHSTGIYCRPSCPARTPAETGVTFFPTSAAAQDAGYRACKRCLPDASPGSPEWDVRGDVAGRAMRLINEGLVDRDGVEGLAARLGYTGRHLNRLLTAELGAGPLALARSRRAQSARTLIETTALSFSDIAYASGFSSIRQFNACVREVYASSPSELRRASARRTRPAMEAGWVQTRIAVRTPYAGRALLDFLRPRCVAGVEQVGVDDSGRGFYRRTLRLPYGPGEATLWPPDVAEPGRAAFVAVRLRLSDLRDTAWAMERLRRLVDADADPVAITEVLCADPVLATLRAATPGLRVPGQTDGAELAIRAVVGQQVGVAAATTILSRLAEEYGERSEGGLCFPTATALAELDPSWLPMPRTRAEALQELCRRIAAGDLDLDLGAERGACVAALREIPGIGAWTADYIAMRALGDPDVLLRGDAAVREGARRSGIEPSDRALEARAAHWRPWRSYAVMHLWERAARPRSSDEGDQSCGR